MLVLHVITLLYLPCVSLETIQCLWNKMLILIHTYSLFIQPSKHRQAKMFSFTNCIVISCESCLYLSNHHLYLSQSRICGSQKYFTEFSLYQNRIADVCQTLAFQWLDQVEVELTIEFHSRLSRWRRGRNTGLLFVEPSSTTTLPSPWRPLRENM